MFENPFKKKSNEIASKTENKPQKSQEELREILRGRFKNLEMSVNAKLSEYTTAIENEVFQDAEGEERGEGEKRKLAIQATINSLLERAEKTKTQIESKKELPQFSAEIRAKYKGEEIHFDFEKSFEDFDTFYKKHKLETPADFEDLAREVWERNREEIEKAIEEKGFDEFLIVPETTDLPELHKKMTEGYNTTWQGSNFEQGGSFVGAKSRNIDKVRIVLVHKKNAQNMADREELKKTRNILGKDVDMDNTLTLEDYLIFQKKYFEETGEHLDADGWTWLATKSEARLVHALWRPDDAQLDVYAWPRLSEWLSRCSPLPQFFLKK